MAVLGRLLVGSQQRIDLPDFLSLQSYVASDFKYLIKSFIGDRALILKGFEIIDAPQSIQSNTISIKVADSVVYYPSSSAGSFFYGLPEGQALSAPLSPTLKENATNYVYVTLTTSGQGQDTRAFWDVDLNGGEGGEFNQDINTEGVLVAQAGVSTSGFPDGTVPIAIVDMGVAAINKITDARNLMFRLGSGGVSPNSNATFQFPPLPSAEYARNEPPSTIQSAASDNPFFGGDKNIQSLKDWMDAVMTKLLELSGTTYWYETTQALNLVNIFDDALGSSVKSKGRWNHDESQPGIITWSEDIVYRKMNDRRDILIKANPNDGVQLQNEQVMWIQLERNQPVNPLDTPLKFLQNTAYIDADQAGSFSNINIGDWIKRRGDNENLYVRVKGFLDSDGLIATPSTATRAVLENAYQGAEATESAVYTKGVYSNADIKVNNRNDVAAYASGGDFYWLANRSDTVMSIQSISHQLVAGVQVVEADGKKAKLRFTSSHGLVDGDRIVVADAPAYNGTYQIDKISDTEISIETTGTGSATAVVSWAIVTTKSTEIGIAGSPDQLEIESANHGFSSNQTISISGTGVSAYDTYDGGGGGAGKYLINTRTNTQFQIPFYNSTAVNAAAGDATCAKVILKTEFGAIEVIQGESIDINQPDAVNIMQFVGMESISQTAPNYFLSASYNALQGTANFNSSDNDNLTTRAAKLTAMMADRVQDRDAQIVGRITVRNEASGLQQFISVSGGPIDLLLPGTGRCEVTFPSSFYLDSYKAVTATFNRNETNQIVSVNTSENLDDLALESYKYNLNENKIVLFYRLNGTEIYTWDGSAILNSSSWTSNDYETSQNKNIIVKDEAGVVFNSTTSRINYTSNGLVKILIPGSNCINQIDIAQLKFDTVNFPTSGILINSGQSAWVRINRANSITKIFNKIKTLATDKDSNAEGALYITNTPDVPTDQDVFVLYSVEGAGENLAFIKHHHHFDAGNIYEEHSVLTANASSGALITLPNDSRNFNIPRKYIVGSGQLEVFLNGQRLRNAEDYLEIGTSSQPSSTIQTLNDLVIDDTLTFRISGSGGIYTAPAGYSTSTFQQIYDNSAASNHEILTVSSYPMRVAAPGASHKSPLPSTVALSVAGDLAVSGIIDPTAITFIPQAANPLAGNEAGLWIDTSENLRYQAAAPNKSINVTESISTLNESVATINSSIQSANTRLNQIENTIANGSGNSFESVNNSGSVLNPGSIVKVEEMIVPGAVIENNRPFEVVLNQETVNDELILEMSGYSARAGQTFATPITSWTARTSPADSNTWRSVCWSAELGLFVAVANSGTSNGIMTSPDGITWTGRTSPIANIWLSVCWSPQLGLFVAVGSASDNDSVITSPDGINWTLRTSVSTTWRSVCWSAELGLFVAVGSGVNRVMTSADGITWTARTPAANNTWQSVCWSPQLGLFVAVANATSGLNRVMTSPDGITWTIRASAASKDWQSVCWSPQLGLFVAVASGGIGNNVMTSSDGITWTANSPTTDASWLSVCWSPELALFVAVGSANNGSTGVITSPDGVTWTASSASINSWQSICWSAELRLFVTVASGGSNPRIMTSPIAIEGTKEFNKISVLLTKFGTGSGSFTMEIYQPSQSFSSILEPQVGSPIAVSAELNVANINGTSIWYDFVFTQPVQLKSNLQYVFYLKPNNITTDFISIHYSSSSATTTGAHIYQGVVQNGDLAYRIYGRDTFQQTMPSTIVSSVKPASAASIADALMAVGITQGLSSSNGAACTVQTNGVITVPNGSFYIGQIIYLSASVPGAITTTKPTAYGSAVLSLGVAISSTQFVLNPKLISVNIGTYEETQVLTSGAAVGTVLTLPLDSKAQNSVRNYTVGSNHLTVYCNGQKLYKNIDYQEFGASGSESNKITISKNIASDSVLEYRIQAEQGLVSALSLV